MKKSHLEKERINYIPRVPKILENVTLLDIAESPCEMAKNEEISSFLPHSVDLPSLSFQTTPSQTSSQPLVVGVVLSGGQAAGGHNVIAGIFDALQQFHPASSLFGFLDGPGGIVDGKYKKITTSFLQEFRNTGGFNIIGSGRTKIETQEQFEGALKTVQKLSLDGLIVIGGDDSNTNAAYLAEYFLAKKCPTKVVGVPKTIDGDLKNAKVEISFGFDTACKTYSELIGNISKDALSAKKYYHFIKLMGRSASHVALECALQTHPNLVLIGEEIFREKKSLLDITHEIVDVICKRAALGKNYGIILIAEGLVEFVPEVKHLLREINLILANDPQNDVVNSLSEESKKTFDFLPEKIQQQFLLDRDPHGNVQVSLIATDDLFIHAVKKELKKRSDYQGKFNPISHFFGYEGRSATPSNFDANYCYALGLTAASLIAKGKTGYMSVIVNLSAPIEEWKPEGIPLTAMMGIEERKGKKQAVIRKTLVDLQGEPFTNFVNARATWMLEDEYCAPGPIQFFGPSEICDTTTLTLQMENRVVY